LRSKITGFCPEDIERAKACKLHLEKQDRLAELELHEHVRRLAKLEEKQKQLEYQDRTSSSSSDLSNYDTPTGSSAPTPAKVKGKLKKSIDQVTNALSFSFLDSILTRSSFKKKEWTGWPPKS